MLQNSKTHEPLLLTIKHHDVKVTIELPWDSSLDEVFNALRGAIVATGWSSSQFDNEILNQADYIKELEESEELKDEDKFDHLID